MTGAYWVYENWTVRRARAHADGCSHMKTRVDTSNGRWHGPFLAEQAALSVVTRRGNPVLRCGFCLGRSIGTTAAAAPAQSRPQRRPSGTTQLQDRVHLLIEHLDDYLDAFERHQPFRADQVQAHRAALERRARYHSAEELLDDPEFFRLVIDVLRSWQMDVRGARLSSLADIHAAFRAHAETLTRLWPLSLDQLRISDLQPVHADLWRLISEIRVSATASNIVAASKAVHHVLPDLLPPIDRRYTLAFLGYGSAFSVSKERDAFDRAFPIFHQIAWRRPDVIRRRLGLGMHTTVGKVIDNAIVGFVVTEMRG